MNLKRREPLARGVCPLQRGFVPGRQLLANVVDLDAFGHAHGMSSVVGDPAVLAFWDFAAAFPSLARQADDGRCRLCAPSWYAAAP